MKQFETWEELQEWMIARSYDNVGVVVVFPHPQVDGLCILATLIDLTTDRLWKFTLRHSDVLVDGLADVFRGTWLSSYMEDRLIDGLKKFCPDLSVVTVTESQRETI